jgi:ectoine hydroxylase-related dioxygenase (phytanoyl-CoA dioxygenase family)
MTVTQDLLDEQYGLAPDQPREYRNNGHILLRGLASPEEVAGYQPLIRQVVEEFARKRETQGRTEDYSKLFVQVTNIWRLSEQIRRFVFAKRFARVAAELMGVNGVRLYHDQALFKPAGGKGTPWHQDQVYWPLDTHNTITMWMPMIDITRDMGTMQFASGSHLKGPLADVAISDESDRLFERLVREQAFSLVSYDLRAGDATFHGGWTAHAAFPNAGNRMREVMTIIYFADGARLIEPDNEFRRVDMEVFHPGLKAGEMAASALNPLLYTAR